MLHVKLSRMDKLSRGTEPDPWFITGLLQRDGSFTFSRSAGQLVMMFGVKMREDHDLLQDLLSFFNVGRIYGGIFFRVSNRHELGRVIEHFDEFPPRGSKLRSYEIWREMVLLREESFRRQPVDRLEELAAELRRVAPRRRSARRVE